MQAARLQSIRLRCTHSARVRSLYILDRRLLHQDHITERSTCPRIRTIQLIMDGLSAAASVMAVMLLAFQLAHSTKKLFDFWESIQDAPEDVRNVKSDLELLTKVLEHIAREAQQQSSDPMMESALRLCSDKIDTIMSLTLDLEPDFAFRKFVIRKWGAFLLVLRREKVKHLRKSLDRMKETLMMVQLSSIGY